MGCHDVLLVAISSSTALQLLGATLAIKHYRSYRHRMCADGERRLSPV